MKVNSNLDIVTFSAVANQITDGYFDNEGIYSPAIGKLMAMCVFFNVCVDKSDYSEKFANGVTDIEDLDEVITKDFITAYNDAIARDGEAIDFANAYSAAMDAVETKKSSFGYLVDVAVTAIDKIASDLNETLSDEKIEILKKISDGLVNGENLAAAIVSEYSKKLSEK